MGGTQSFTILLTTHAAIIHASRQQNSCTISRRQEKQARAPSLPLTIITVTRSKIKYTYGREGRAGGQVEGYAWMIKNNRNFKRL